jgi:hypothetical protein
MVKQILICESTGEYVTLSSDSIRFWRRLDLEFRGLISQPGLFVSMAIFDGSGQIAVATSSRLLLVYDLESLEQLPTEISASPPARAIKKMSCRECRQAIQVLSSSELPLYNVPTAMYAADFTDHEAVQRIVFIRDDQGILQVFRFRGPSRRHSLDVKIERVGRHVIHRSSITQLSLVRTCSCYATSSVDATIKF